MCKEVLQKAVMRPFSLLREAKKSHLVQESGEFWTNEAEGWASRCRERETHLLTSQSDIYKKWQSAEEARQQATAEVMVLRAENSSLKHELAR